MIRITLQPAPQDVSLFRLRGPKIIAALVARMDRLMIQLQSYIIQEKLSGQLLHRRSGVLASSVRVVPTVVEGTIVRGAVQAGGGPAFYAAVHESGGQRAFDVYPNPPHRVLRFIAEGEVVFARHVHHPPLPQRPFMESSLNEMRRTIVEGIHEAYFTAIKES